MKVLAKRNVIASGKALDAGKTYDISDEDASLLIRMGKVVEAPVECSVPEKPKAKKPKVLNNGVE
tara:strand:- start:2960 stop:3154 length:195 start_codon:yes stop_codon:yes gene_type:complete